jgi:hypothetical protein
MILLKGGESITPAAILAIFPMNSPIVQIRSRRGGFLSRPAHVQVKAANDRSRFHAAFA